MTMSMETPSENKTVPVVSPPKRGSWWSRHITIINFWLDVALLALFLVQCGIFAVLHAVFPRGAGGDWTVWGASPLDWSEMLFRVFCVFSAGIVLHLMLHWDWICGVVATRLLHRKAGKDDGSYTLIGVGILVLLVHLLAGGILAARMALVGPS
ncbi:MAG: hypothetical protein U0872_00740 [Planctomycetaceae bacterium]